MNGICEARRAYLGERSDPRNHVATSPISPGRIPKYVGPAPRPRNGTPILIIFSVKKYKFASSTGGNDDSFTRH